MSEGVDHPGLSSTTHEKPKNRVSQVVNSILHGSEALKQDEQQTYSKVLARGKYVHELQSECLF